MTYFLIPLSVKFIKNDKKKLTIKLSANYFKINLKIKHLLALQF